MLQFSPEMKKILIFGTILAFSLGATAHAAVRDGVVTSGRTKANSASTQSRVSTTVVRSNTDNSRNTATRGATSTRQGTTVLPRAATNLRTVTRSATQVQNTTARTTGTGRGTTARAATMAETRTGAAYNQCKSAYFQCMDQFCALKNDEYRRCSCNARALEFDEIRKNLEQTNAKLSEFTENLDMVGMTAAQATAVHTASDGENAITRDMSASKALLTAIMNSIRGGDTTVGGSMSDLNSINLSFDTSMPLFGLSDSAQVVAAYNGTELYNAVYPSCRAAVHADCNDASLQRAVTAYLMAIEQDCNTVQSALVQKQKELKSAVREGSAMLDLARIENRKKHNSDDMTTCLNNVESAILSEQVCGANYHKCLDNGEFIDITTGKPITGVVNFYELGNLLKFDFAKDSVDQKLSQNPRNKTFVTNFENKTKKFAVDALDKCTEIADQVWSEYLDKALLDIYYAQQSKVKTIQTGCLDLISSCYQEKDTAITAAMATLITGESDLSLIPDKIVLTKQMCSDYITSCNNMFNENGENIIAEYIDAQTNSDTLSACRAVAQKCFDDFGGTRYENFYNPSSGLFTSGVDSPVEYDGGLVTNQPIRTALDWFSLYEYDADGKRVMDRDGSVKYKSECAKRVAAIDSCRNIVPAVFGGLDAVIAHQTTPTNIGQYIYTKPTGTDDAFAYGWTNADDLDTSSTGIWDTNNYSFKNRRLRPTGVATEVYNQIIDELQTQCMNVQGKFVEAQFIDHTRYGARTAQTLCHLNMLTDVFDQLYGISGPRNPPAVQTYTEYPENMCPKDYTLSVDTAAWGICSCWENGGRRSKYGIFTKCAAVLPVVNSGLGNPDKANDRSCKKLLEDTEANWMILDGGWSTNNIITVDYWCTSDLNTETNQVCPIGYSTDTPPSRIIDCDAIPSDVPQGVKN